MAAFILPLITAGISAATGFLGNKPQVTTTKDNTSSSSSTNPDLSNLQSDLLNTAGFGALKQYNDGPSDLSGYTANGLSTINSGSQARQIALKNALASRGQSFSPSAGYLENQNQSDNIKNQDDFLQTIPLVKRQMQQQNLSQLMSQIGPYGSSSTSSGSDTKTVTSPNNSAAGGLSGGLMGSIGGGLSSLLSSLFGGGGGSDPGGLPGTNGQPGIDLGS